MTKIIVKNGNWDKARSELGDVFDAKKKSFDTQFEAAFGSTRKPAAAQPAAPAAAKPATAKPSGSAVLARSRFRA
jgi:hypothetical protein